MSKIGSEILANTQHTGDQVLADIAKLENGCFVTVWVDHDASQADGSQSGIKARVFSSEGTPLGNEILVNSATDGWQVEPVVTALSGGNFVVTWTDGWRYFSYADHPGSLGIGGAMGDTWGDAVKAQVFSADGSPIGTEILVNTEIRDDQELPQITALSNGNFVVAWTDWNLRNVYLPDGSLYSSMGGGGIRAQVFDSTGQKVGVELAITGQYQYEPRITALDDGGFVIVWRDSDYSMDDIRAQVFAADGTEVSSEIVVNTSGNGPTFQVQDEARVSALNNGGFVITWTDRYGDDNSYGVKAQVFDAAGGMIGTEIQVNTSTYSYQKNPHVTVLAQGGFVITWDSWAGLNTGTDTDVNAQLFDDSGVRIGTEIIVNTIPGGDQTGSEVAALEDGGFVVSWVHMWDDVYYQIFDASGSRNGSQMLANTTTAGGQQGELVRALDGDVFVIGWTDNMYSPGDGSGTAVKLQVFDTTPPDTAVPEVMVFSPADGAIEAGIVSDIEVTFSEPIQRGSGTIAIHSGSASGPVVASYDAATSANLAISGSTLTIDPTADLDYSTRYYVTFEPGTVKDLAGNSYAGTSVYDFTTTQYPPLVPVVCNGVSVMPARYTGTATVAGGQPINFQYIGDGTDEVLIGTEYNDFINVTGGVDAVDAGAGNDVIDGGTGSNFLTGGMGTDIFFSDGRGGQITWSTITDWQSGEQLSVWGWTPGTSRIAEWTQAGAAGYEGLTMHADLNGDNVIDTSVTLRASYRSRSCRRRSSSMACCGSCEPTSRKIKQQRACGFTVQSVLCG